MDFYIIPTLQNMELSLTGDRLFCLAHFYKQYPDYRKFFIETREKYPEVFVTLDNSAAERSLVTEDVLYDIVGELKPNEVVAPDVLFDKQATMDNLDSFAEGMKRRGFLQHTDIFGCPQGKTREDWVECYDYMLNHPSVSVIGMSKIAIPYAFLDNPTADQGIMEARHKAIDFLWMTDRIKKDLHFLGMGNPTEYKKYVEMGNPHLRSSDSCYTVLAATKGIDFEESPDVRVETTDDFYEKSLTAEELSMSIRNIAFLKWYNIKGV